MSVKVKREAPQPDTTKEILRMKNYPLKSEREVKGLINLIKSIVSGSATEVNYRVDIIILKEDASCG